MGWQQPRDQVGVCAAQTTHSPKRWAESDIRLDHSDDDKGYMCVWDVERGELYHRTLRSVCVPDSDVSGGRFRLSQVGFLTISPGCVCGARGTCLSW